MGLLFLVRNKCNIINMPIERKTFIKKAFVFLLVFPILLLSFFAVKFYSCIQIPLKYSFLEDKIISKSCYEKKYLMRGLIYSIKDDTSDSVSLGINLWDYKDQSNIYLPNLEIPYNHLDKDKIKNLKNYEAITLELTSVKDISDLTKFFSDNNKIKIGIDTLYFSQDDIELIKNSIAEAILSTPIENSKSEDLLFQKSPKVSITEVFNDGESIYFSNGRDNKQLYAPWALSFLVKENSANEINKENLLSILQDEDVINYGKDNENTQTECLDPDICQVAEISEGLTMVLNENIYHFNNSLSCVMIYDISENLEYKDEYLQAQYCSSEELKYGTTELFEGKANGLNGDNYVLSYLQSLTPSRFTSGEYQFFEYDFLSFSNLSSSLLDSYYSTKLAGGSLIDMEFEKQLIAITSTMVEKDNFALKDVCQIDSFLRLVQNEEKKILGNEYMDQISAYKTIFSESRIDENILRLTENNLNNWYFCLSNENTTIVRSLLLRAYYQNFYSSENKKGLWYDDKYNIKDNAYFLKTIIEYEPYLTDEK